MTRTALTMLITVACLAGPAAAQAATGTGLAPRAVENDHADRAALGAYVTYLQTLVADKPTAKQAEQSFAASSMTLCKGALTPIVDLTSVPPSWTSALTQIGTELGDDATLEFTDTAALAFGQLGTALSTLHWGTATPAVGVKRFVNAETALLALPVSNLCGDALDVAAAAQANPQTLTPPTATVAFLQSYQIDSTLANTRLTTFVKLLDTYETPADKALAAKIDTLARRVAILSTTTIASGTDALKLALGITTANPERNN